MTSGKHLNRTQTWLVSLLTGVVITGTCLWYGFGDDLQWVDNFIYDLHIKWRGRVEPSGNLVLVLMDRDSAVELDRLKGHWRRRQLAQALDNLCNAGAAVIGLDMILHSRDPDSESDEILSSAIERCNNIVLATGMLTHGGDLLPLETFRSAAISEGFIDFPLDMDEVLRRIRFFKSKIDKYGIELIPSFSLELARTFLDIEYVFEFQEDKPYFIMGAENGKQLKLPNPNMLINYGGDSTSFTNLSYVDIVKNRFKPAAVDGKIVVIGSSLATSKDVFSTPFTRFGLIDSPLSLKNQKPDRVLAKDLGLACHAHAAETIISGKFIRSIPKPFVLFITILFGAIGSSFYLPRFGTVLEILELCIGFFIFIVSAHLLFRTQLIRLDVAPLFCVFSGQFICGIAFQKFFGKKRTAMITAMFSKYVSPAVVNELMRAGVNLESRRQEITVLFSDLRNFTELSERLGPKNTGRLLNAYFDAMIPIVFDHQGTLDKLIGDAIMAFFGAPVEVKDHPVKSAETALDMLESLESLKKMTDIPGIKNLQAGIGLNTGMVTIGNLGCERFMDYTVIGDAVNLASRLEGLNKLYETHIIVSEFTADKLDGRFLLRKLDKVRVKGKKDAVTIFELVGYKKKADARTLEIVKTFESGFDAYLDRNWQEANEKFNSVLELHPDDGAARLYVERISLLREMPIDEDWDGVTTLRQK